MDPWYKVATPRKEVREGGSCNPDEFAMALEQSRRHKAPEDSRKPEQVFARTYFTKALVQHCGMMLRRAGVAALGPAAGTTPPGTDAIARVFEAAGGPVLLRSTR
jgi:hypothetical protein